MCTVDDPLVTPSDAIKRAQYDSDTGILPLPDSALAYVTKLFSLYLGFLWCISSQFHTCNQNGVAVVLFRKLFT